MSQTSCHNCVHSRSNKDKNSAHIHCHLYWSYYKKQKSSHPKANEYAVKSGWWDFPYDYDPVWMEEDCKHFNQKP